MNDLSDMRYVIAPKSDQINNEDLLITGPMTITITDIVIHRDKEQPVSIFFDNESGKVYRPCKNMSKVLFHFFGDKKENYIGRSLTLYRDPDVMWGPNKTGGIRISHLSHINATEKLVLRESRTKIKEFIIQPLKLADKPAGKPPEPKKLGTIADWITGTLAPELSTCEDIQAVAAVQQGKFYVAAMEREGPHRTEMKRLIDAAIARIEAADGEQEVEADGAEE